MQAQEVKLLIEKAPFEAFIIPMANGSQSLVAHPGVAMFSTNKQHLAIAVRGGGFATIDLRLATPIEMELRPERRHTR